MAASGDITKGIVEDICEYPINLRVTSTPNKLEVNKNNWNAEFHKSEWQTQPVVQFESATPNKTYTLISIDPDAPLHFKGESVLHWLVTNINGQDLVTGDLSQAKVYQEYRGPGPPPFTGFHRYIFLIYEEEGINQEIVRNNRRLKFKLQSWLREQTKQLNGPIAGIQFRAKF